MLAKERYCQIYNNMINKWPIQPDSTFQKHQKDSLIAFLLVGLMAPVDTTSWS